MKKIGILFLMIALAFSACRKNIDEVDTTENPYVPPVLEKWEQPVVPVQGDLTGFVVDENGQPVADAAVKMGSLSTNTDAFGHFFFKEVELNARGSLVQIEKSGYFPGSRRFFAVNDTENRIKVKLIPKSFDYSFATENGGEVVMNGGAKVNFQPNSIQDADGIPYTGTVRVAAQWLNPDERDILDQMPGNLQGVDVNSEEVVLSTAGMIAVELEDEMGQPLNIREGYTATISMPVPDFLQGNAPEEIPNWSYNEAYGMWVEEGVSKLVGNEYVGEVSHFSYWNHDFKDPLVEFMAIIQNEEGMPLDNYKVVIRQPGTNLYGFGTTCADGSIAGLIPQDYDLLLEVLDLCGNVIYSENIGPFSDDTDLGIITVSEGSLNGINLAGTLVDCNGNPIPNGVVIYELGFFTGYEYADDNGAFDFTFSTCEDDPEVTVTGANTSSLLQSEAITVQTTSGGTTDFGLINVCDESLENYMRVTIDGENAIYLDARIGTDSMGNTIIFQYFNQGGDVSNINLIFYGEEVGNYGGINGNTIQLFSDEANAWNLQGFLENFEVSSFGTSGEPVIGTFSGTLTNTLTMPPEEVDVSGDFNIIYE